jgi:DHA2 family multidrug resistance protein
VTPFNNALQMPDVTPMLNPSTDTGRAILDGIINKQAAIVAYANDFNLLMIMTIAVIPLVFVIATPRREESPADAAVAAH